MPAPTTTLPLERRLRHPLLKQLPQLVRPRPLNDPLHDRHPNWRAASRTVMAAASADQQHELPAHVTVLAEAVRLRDLGEREGPRDREREAPGLDQLADLGEHVDRAAGVPPAEPHPVLLRAMEVGDRHDVPRAARELDEVGQDTPRSAGAPRPSGPYASSSRSG